MAAAGTIITVPEGPYTGHLTALIVRCTGPNQTGRAHQVEIGRGLVGGPTGPVVVVRLQATGPAVAIGLAVAIGPRVAGRPVEIALVQD